MKPWSLPVVIGTLVMGWPALWAAEVDGTLSTDVAFQRLLLCLLAAWAGCSLFAYLVDLTVEANEAAIPAEEEAIAAAEAEAAAIAEAEAAAREAELAELAEMSAPGAGAPAASADPAQTQRPADATP